MSSVILVAHVLSCNLVGAAAAAAGSRPTTVDTAAGRAATQSHQVEPNEPIIINRRAGFELQTNQDRLICLKLHEMHEAQSINQASAKLSWANYLKGHGASFLSECREASETAGVTRSESGLELGTLGSIERGHTTENPWKSFQDIPKPQINRS